MAGFYSALTSRMNWIVNCKPEPTDLTNVLVTEWEQIPAARFPNLVQSLLRRAAAPMVADEYPGFSMRFSTITWDEV